MIDGKNDEVTALNFETSVVTSSPRALAFAFAGSTAVGLGRNTFMESLQTHHLTPDERAALGRRERKTAPRVTHAAWSTEQRTHDVLASLLELKARSGDPIAIGSYLGSGPVVDRAIAEFAHAYADQNEADHSVLVQAIAAGTAAAEDGV